MKIRYFSLAACFTLFLITACDQEFLDTESSTEFSDATVWSDPALVETFINQIYFRLDEPLTDGRMKANIVDEAHYRGNSASFNFNNSNITQDVLPAWSMSRYRSWGDVYKSIRYCNLFFSKIDEVPFSDAIIDGKSVKDRMTGEVHFLRAMLFFNLTSTYGGIPLIDNVYSLSDEFKIPRSTYADCISFIVEECDKAAGLLPLVNTGVNNGRATKGAALALKSRVLLYAASDLYNTGVFGNYEKPELIRYTDSNRSARWEAAKNAAKAVIDLGQYGLYKAEPGASDNIVDNLDGIFLSQQTEEDIFIKFFTTNMGQRFGLYTSPNGYHGWGTNAPIADLVDDYEMADGTKFDWNNPGHAANPYQNREPRFYATILHNGASWRVRPDDVRGLDPLNRIQTGKWETWDAAANKMVEVYGVDTRKSTVEDWNGSYTGYYCRKYVDPAIDAQYVRQAVTWRFFRYAEILLNYAEACIELQQDDEARLYINMVRKRAGLPGVTESGAALRERYRNERRIELAFEEHRFFDVRRWVIGPLAYAPIHVANVVYKMNPDHTTATTPIVTHVPFENHTWNDKAYFLPIMRDELNKNDQLVQNPGY
ncbi:MAG: RagB/SusD family nutrient uptake outer membrane protein [Prolixibacteraceae bacterium]